MIDSRMAAVLPVYALAGTVRPNREPDRCAFTLGAYLRAQAEVSSMAATVASDLCQMRDLVQGDLHRAKEGHAWMWRESIRRLPSAAVD